MYGAAVPTCLSVSICPPTPPTLPPQPLPDRYADYGYRVNSHLRRVKKGENKNKSLYTKRTREATPSSPSTLLLSHFRLLASISAVPLCVSLPRTTHPGTSPSHDPFCRTFDAVSVQRPFIRNIIARVVRV